jgi:molybdate transport repressor ModE-like protein
VIGNTVQGWRRLELRHIAALEAIERTGSFRAAARELGYSQAAVSGQVRALEAIAGTVLVERPRGGGRATLTAAGRIVLHHGRRAAAALGAARADLAAAAGSLGTLRVGVFPSVSARVLPGIVAAFRRTGEPIRITIEERIDDGDLLRLVEAGALDVAFTAAGRASRLAVDELAADAYVLLTRAATETAARASVSPAEIVGLPLIDFRELPPDHLASTRLPGDPAGLDVVFRTNDNETVHELVARGVGFAVLPWLCVDPYDPRVVAVPIRPPLRPRPIAIAWLDGRTRLPGIEAFRGAAREAAAAAMAACV